MRQLFPSMDLSGRSLLLVSLLMLLPFSGSIESFAQPQVTEPELKAAFLLNFASYVEWPPERLGPAGSPFVFGIVDSPDLADNLEALSRQRLVKERPVEVRRLEAGDGLDGVHMLFLGRESGRQGAYLLEEAIAASVLTVTEDPAVRPDGSVIHFVVVDGRIRFEVSLDAAQRAGLTVSSRLLGVAQRVIRETL